MQSLLPLGLGPWWSIRPWKTIHIWFTELYGKSSEWIRVNWWLLRIYSEILLQYVWPILFQKIVLTFSEQERSGWSCRCFFSHAGQSICWTSSMSSTERFGHGHWMSLWILRFISSKNGKVFPSLSFCPYSSSQLLTGSLVLVPEFIVSYCGLLKHWKSRAAESVDPVVSFSYSGSRKGLPSILIMQRKRRDITARTGIRRKGKARNGPSLHPLEDRSHVAVGLGLTLGLMVLQVLCECSSPVRYYCIPEVVW